MHRKQTKPLPDILSPILAKDTICNSACRVNIYHLKKESMLTNYRIDVVVFQCADIQFLFNLPT